MALLAGLGSGASGLVAARRVGANCLLNNPNGNNPNCLLNNPNGKMGCVFVLDMDMPQTRLIAPALMHVKLPIVPKA